MQGHFKEQLHTEPWPSKSMNQDRAWQRLIHAKDLFNVTLQQLTQVSEQTSLHRRAPHSLCSRGTEAKRMTSPKPRRSLQQRKDFLPILPGALNTDHPRSPSMVFTDCPLSGSLCKAGLCSLSLSQSPMCLRSELFTHSPVIYPIFTSLNHHRITSFPSIQPGNTAVYVPDQHVILSPGLTKWMLLHTLFDTDRSVLQEKEKPQTNKTA